MTPLPTARGITRRYDPRIGCEDVSFDLWPGEALGIVGESGSGKFTLLSCLSGHMFPDAGEVIYDTRDGGSTDIRAPSEPRRRMLVRTDWVFVHQNPRDGLRMTVSAGASLGERLMAMSARHDRNIRDSGAEWPGKVEIAEERMEDRPRSFGRHAEAPPDRAEPRDRPAAGVHGGADGGPRRLGAGAAAGSDPRAGASRGCRRSS